MATYLPFNSGNLGKAENWQTKSRQTVQNSEAKTLETSLIVSSTHALLKKNIPDFFSENVALKHGPKPLKPTNQRPQLGTFGGPQKPVLNGVKLTPRIFRAESYNPGLCSPFIYTAIL